MTYDNVTYTEKFCYFNRYFKVTARSKNAIENWFKDLAGSKPLTVLAKKVKSIFIHVEIFVFYRLCSEYCHKCHVLPMLTFSLNFFWKI